MSQRLRTHRTGGSQPIGGRTTAVVTSDGRPGDRSALAAVRALAAAGYAPVVATSGTASLAAASRHAWTVVGVPPPIDDDFAAAVDAVASEHRAVAIFASSDAALVALRPSLVDLVDKAGLAANAAQVGVEVPSTTTFGNVSDLLAAAPHLPYPLVVKPAGNQPGSPPAYCAHRPEDLTRPDDDGPMVVQPYVDGPMKAVAGVVWAGELVVAVQQAYVRTWPRECGTASFAVVEPIDTTLVSGLDTLMTNHDGIFQAQFVGGALVDLNLRVYGSMPLALAAGVNLPEVVCRLAAGEAPDRTRPRIGTAYRWLEGDLRHLSTALRADPTAWRAMVRAAAPRRGVAHSVASLNDPRPSLARMRHVVGSLAGGRGRR